ncbi:hypothetical protein ACQR05_16630 [Bradyrhizobium oligotrophicum]|uniref:hypothetical protein n=1 Tax=Bradyrhizobium oligotrophicum TaxID=44255 RepID=UPI003EB7FFBD
MPKTLRRTTDLNPNMVQNIFRAFDFAKAGGAPLNVYAVINLRDLPEQSAATAFERIRHKYRDWLAYHSRKLGVRLPPMYVFTFEAPGVPHVNWVLRVPPRLQAEFFRKLPKWVERVQGRLQPFDIDARRIEERGYKSLANYISKGCNPRYIRHFYLTDLHNNHGHQGEFWGKRAGVSPALNKSARKAVNYDHKRRRLPDDSPTHPLPDVGAPTSSLVASAQRK